jgi:hypothetical protein
MNDATRAQDMLIVYRRYSDMARRTTGEISENYQHMAREMLRRVSSLDLAVVAVARAANNDGSHIDCPSVGSRFII